MIRLLLIPDNDFVLNLLFELFCRDRWDLYLLEKLLIISQFSDFRIFFPEYEKQMVQMAKKPIEIHLR